MFTTQLKMLKAHKHVCLLNVAPLMNGKYNISAHKREREKQFHADTKDILTFLGNKNMIPLKVYAKKN